MPFPTTPILDNFDRADEGPPPSSSWSYPVYATAAGEKVVSNQAGSDVDTAATAYWNSETFLNVEVYGTVAAVSTHYLFARIQQPGVSTVDGYMLVGSGFNVQVYRLDNGVATAIGATGISSTLSAGQGRGMSIIGDEIQILRRVGESWDLSLTRTDITYQSAGYIGLGHASGTVSRWDDFGGGAWVGTGQGPPLQNIDYSMFPKLLLRLS